MYLELFFSKKLIKIYFITHIMSVNKSLINKKRRITDKKEKILSIILGIITGAINGIFGGGGGMIVVPMLIWLMKYEEKIAHATAILLILPLSIVSGIFYAVFGNFDIKVGIPTGLGVVLGGAIGALLLSKLKSKTLGIIFSVIMLVAAVKMLFF